MLKAAFSSIACPDWTLDEIARAAAAWGFAGIELRSFGHASTRLASDPAHTDGGKVRHILREEGVDLAGIATGIRFDQPIFPPVIGLLSSRIEDSIRAGRRAIETTEACGGQYVRVYGFAAPEREKPSRAIKRIAERLARVCDHARHRDVYVVIENGGGFARAEDLLDLVDRVACPFLRTSYDLKTAVAAGDDPVAAVELLGPILLAGRIRDIDGQGNPVALGDGILPCAAFAAALAAADAWAIYTWDRLWLPNLAPAETMLPAVARQLYDWGKLSSANSAIAARSGTATTKQASAELGVDQAQHAGLTSSR